MRSGSNAPSGVVHDHDLDPWGFHPLGLESTTMYGEESNPAPGMPQSSSQSPGAAFIKYIKTHSIYTPSHLEELDNGGSASTDAEVVLNEGNTISHSAALQSVETLLDYMGQRGFDYGDINAVRKRCVHI
ncbi:hypothetical protein AVEN_223761-1 [Araneus ventricosus]|uniref:Uncharacterized protein n=1 Tax=Araneus ventricosus TaxID=182803 RepID=A0A4Y2QYM2_ARAVE|nr:hypothetical protein AVEN_223761-1 [Araneus ventricosus]